MSPAYHNSNIGLWCKHIQGQKASHFNHTVLLVWCCRCSDVTDLIKATPEPDILRRDINDRPPIL
jgi:hypothetical protein